MAGVQPAFRRSMSTATQGKQSPPSFLSKVVDFSTSRNGMITIAGTGFAVSMGVMATKIMSTFAHLNFYTVFEIGFVAGLLTSTAGLGFVSYFQRVRTIDVERTMSDALEIVQHSPQVAEQMGLTGFSFGSVQTGTVRTYQMDGGRFVKSETTGLPVWSRPRIQLMFQIWGGSNERQAVVCCEAFTKTSTTGREFSLVSFDLLESKSGDQGNNPTILVVGDSSKLAVRNELRSIVTLHKVYVKGLQ